VSKIYDALKRAERERSVAREQSRHDDVASLPPVAIEPDRREEDDYRRLRASLLSTPAYSELHTILVTASRHGEGVTRVALGLAKALAAEPETRVLLFEANLRSPSLATMVPARNGKGLSDHLMGSALADELITAVPEWNLSVVFGGDVPAAVNCEAIVSVLSGMQSRFDFVIIDAPPVNRYADVSVIAPRVDGAILVVEADETPVVDAESAKRSLERVGARIFGVVLNRRRSYVPAALQAFL
jgi:protein-tyrosine kinase